MKRCGTRHYENIGRDTIESMLSALRSKGAITRGSNPWNVELPEYDVKLTGTWDVDTMILSITIHKVGWFITHQTVWSTIDRIMTVINHTATRPEPLLRTTSLDGKLSQDL